MDEDVEYFTPKITPEGVAGVWLSQHIPTADRSMQKHLGRVITGMMIEAMRKAKQDVIVTLGKSPTVGAAIASLEADIIEIERATKLQRDDGIDYNIWDF